MARQVQSSTSLLAFYGVHKISAFAAIDWPIVMLTQVFTHLSTLPLLSCSLLTFSSESPELRGLH